MDAITIDRWIKGLGQSYNALVIDGVIPDHPLQELYPGRDWLDVEPVPGVELSFWADLEIEDGIELTFWSKTKILDSFFITLMKIMPSTVKYEGELPAPYTSEMNQSDVHAIFGEPMESRGPIKMPEPMGLTGGWESYPLDPAIYPGKKVVIQYTASMEVKTLVFTLIDKGHE